MKTDNPVYNLAMREVEKGYFVALIPSLDDNGPMIWRAVVEEPFYPTHYSRNFETRMRTAIEHIRVIREAEGYSLPSNEDYAEGRH